MFCCVCVNLITVVIVTIATPRAVLVGCVVDVGGGLLHQQGGELQQQDAHSVRGGEGLVRVDDAVDEVADDVVVVVLLRGGRSAHQLVTVPLLEGRVEAGDHDVLQDLKHIPQQQHKNRGS